MTRFIIRFIAPLFAGFMLICFVCSTVPLRTHEKIGSWSQALSNGRQIHVEFIEEDNPIIWLRDVMINDPPYFGSTEQWIIGLNQEALWQPGDTADSMNRFYADPKNYRVRFGSFERSQADVMALPALAMYPIVDKSNRVIGTYGVLEFNIRLDDLPVGTYPSSIIFKHNRGRIFRFNWVFTITES